MLSVELCLRGVTDFVDSASDYFFQIQLGSPRPQRAVSLDWGIQPGSCHFELGNCTVEYVIGKLKE